MLKPKKLIKENDKLSEWIFLKVEKNIYKIQNRNKCYIFINELNITCQNISFKEASDITLIKIYEEVKETYLNNEIIEKEPIDVLIKYIDLKDPNLKRNGFNHIKKDFDNEELRYSIRSIIKNIPWIRKIFILMPNDEIRFFKDYNLINDKIIYVKDKDILGYDSANSISFQFNYWKMKKFGISENFIIMDDDCFIGQPLNKTNFFYVSNGRVIPAIITNKFLDLNEHLIEKIKIRLKKSININLTQNSAEFHYSLYNTYSFILKKLKKTKLFFPVHTHNAIPVNIYEIKEIYDIVYNSEYKLSTLESLYRQLESLQFQTFVLSYLFNKNNRKVINISYKLIQNKNSIFSYYNYSLFCINTGSIMNSNSSFMKTKITMEYLFPIPSFFEKKELLLSDLAFNTINLLEKEINQYIFNSTKKINKLEKRLKKYKNHLKYINKIIILFELFILLFMICWE